MNIRLPSVVVLGSLALTSCFFAPAPPPPRRTGLGPSTAYRDLPPGNPVPGDYRRPDDAYDAPPPLSDPHRSRDPGPSMDAPPSAPAAGARKEYPTAERTNNPNQVLSPYEPYNVIDVTDFKSGQLAKDPSNGKIFRVP